ncbi:MAG: divalent-cation tolerance protein CutA [Micavibrio aeruginosavorus]|nr:divalent-cation tolerance protein CutA [Micavibrio aeruginosavorus]
MSDIVFIYIVSGNESEARKIASVLLAERLIACANIFPEHLSLYRWEGKEVVGAEVAMILKTRAELFDAVAAKVKSLHSYDCPCIVSLPVGQGYSPYLDWIAAETG